MDGGVEIWFWLLKNVRVKKGRDSNEWIGDRGGEGVTSAVVGEWMDGLKV